MTLDFKTCTRRYPGFRFRFPCFRSDEDVLRAMDGLDRQILKAIGYLDSHMQRFNNPTLGLFAADPTKLRLNNLIHDLQDNQNSIYSCK